MRKKHTRISAEEFFREHLHYEIWMLRETYAYMLVGSFGDVMNNALIESYCTHARNLIEFFRYKDSCDYHPAEFVTADFKKNTQFIGDILFTTINEQISHMSHYRTADPFRKIDGPFRTRVFAALEVEIARFGKHLTEHYRSSWKFDHAPTIQISMAAPSATNHLTSI
ncbi:MAG: hypothetical protein U1E62_23800 [Alsobacter sp.]